MHPHSPERRRSARLQLQIPVFLRGLDSAGTEFLELTKTVDISATGALVLSRRTFHPDQHLRITIPVSSEQVSGLVPAETPPIQLRVMRSVPAGDTHLIGIEFLAPLN
jgi:PilZ domain